MWISVSGRLQIPIPSSGYVWVWFSGPPAQVDSKRTKAPSNEGLRKSRQGRPKVTFDGVHAFEQSLFACVEMLIVSFYLLIQVSLCAARFTLA